MQDVEERIRNSPVVQHLKESQGDSFREAEFVSALLSRAAGGTSAAPDPDEVAQNPMFWAMAPAPIVQVTPLSPWPCQATQGVSVMPGVSVMWPHHLTYWPLWG